MHAGAAGGEYNARTPNGQKGGLGAHVRGAKAFNRGDRFFACELSVFLRVCGPCLHRRASLRMTTNVPQGAPSPRLQCDRGMGVTLDSQIGIYAPV